MFLLEFAAYALMLVPQSEKLTLNGPRDAKDADLKKAAEGLRDRLKAEGIKDFELKITTSKSGMEAELIKKDKFTAAQAERIRVLASVPADDPSIAVAWVLTAAESQEFEPYMQKKAPSGWMWKRLGGLWRCIPESGEIPISEFLLQNENDKWFYKPSNVARQKLERVRQDSKTYQAVLNLDATHMITLKAEDIIPDDGRFELRNNQLSGTPAFVLKHPMPFSLRITPGK